MRACALKQGSKGHHAPSSRAACRRACVYGARPALAATIFVSNEKDNTVTVIDSESLAIVKTIPVGARPRGMVLTPDFKELLVCAGDDNRLDVIDTEKLEVSRPLEHRDPIPSCSTSITRGNASTSPTRTTAW